eukprot:2544356-Amphidinium_carterae.3
MLRPLLGCVCRIHYLRESEGKVSSLELLLEVMKNYMPRYHIVRIALLDEIEVPSSHKVNTMMALNQSLKKWLHVLKLAFRRYGVSPEPRRPWLAVWFRAQNLEELNLGLLLCPTAFR